MAIEKINITLADGRKYKLRLPDTLQNIDSNRTAIFVFDDLECFEGCSDGYVDKDGDFIIFNSRTKFGVGLPFRRLVGWAYKRCK